MENSISILTNPGTSTTSELILSLNSEHGFNAPYTFNLTVDNSYQMLFMELSSHNIKELRDFLNQIELL